jgi:DNA-binding transcriptional LysR family regulator
MHDPLFLRQPKGVVPTERAKQLAVPVADILARARQVLASAEAFDPKTSVRRFVLGAPDAASAVLLAPMLSEIRKTAPGIDLVVRNLVGGFDAALLELDQRTLDVAIVPLDDIPARFASRVVYDEDFVIVSAAKNPPMRKMSLARYCAAPHLLVSVSGDPYGFVDRELEARGMKRRVVLTVSNFLQALAVIAESDLIAALPRRFVHKHAAQYKVVMSEPPLPLPNTPLRAVTPKAAAMDAGLNWLLDVLVRTADRVSAPRAKR